MTLLLSGVALPGLAYLGSFEESDGYRIPGAGGSGNILSLNFAGDAQFYLNNVPANGLTGIVAPPRRGFGGGKSTPGEEFGALGMPSFSP